MLNGCHSLFMFEAKRFTMLFHTSAFWLFLIVVFSIHWWLGRNAVRRQNTWLLLVSYFFYSCWDWRFVGLLAFSTLLDYLTGIQIERSDSNGRRKMWLWISVSINVGLLGIYKYFDFFSESMAHLMTQLGMEAQPYLLHLILPVGISFYTFHGLSYVLDIYHKRIQADRNVVDYSLFVSFFPLLVAGPIERATHLLPQLKRARVFDRLMAIDGMRQLLWGVFKKMVIADNCALITNEIFASPGSFNGSSLLLGAVLFSFQIYGDFSGYTDMAIGIAKLFGIDLVRNFAYPYFAQNIAEFFRRWHISLTSWFRDYVYIPLGGSRTTRAKAIRNTFIIFLVSGFWHGANWTFIWWGTLNAIFFLPIMLWPQQVTNSDSDVLSLRTLRRMIQTFVLVTIAWIFFRSETISKAWMYLSGICDSSLLDVPQFDRMLGEQKTILFLVFFVVIEWLGRHETYAIRDIPNRWSRPARWMFYYGLLLCVLWFGGKEQQFIYFQF
jgi:alginate O-acetyltransferase complex protein AlgI